MFWECWRVVERSPRAWRVEALPLAWRGRFTRDPLVMVGDLDECLGLALHRAAEVGSDRVTVWPLRRSPFAVMVSGKLPATKPGVLQAEVV